MNSDASILKAYTILSSKSWQAWATFSESGKSQGTRLLAVVLLNLRATMEMKVDVGGLPLREEKKKRRRTPTVHLKYC